jgi:hypothetical protein
LHPEAAQRAVEDRFIQQEGVVAVGEVDFVPGDVFVRGFELGFEGDGLGGWVDPVAGVGDNEVFGLGSFGLLELVVVDGAGEVEEGVGVEALGELVALVAEVAFDLELDTEAHVGLFLALESATELCFECFLAQKAEMTEHAGNTEAVVGWFILVVVATIKVRIPKDCLTSGLVESNLHCPMCTAGCREDTFANTVWKPNGPLEGLHATHRAASDREKFFDT